MQTGNLTYLYRRTHLLLRRPGFLSSFPRNHSFKPETSQNVLPNTKKSISSVNNRTQISPLSCLITTITILNTNLTVSNRIFSRFKGETGYIRVRMDSKRHSPSSRSRSKSRSRSRSRSRRSRQRERSSPSYSPVRRSRSASADSDRDRKRSKRSRTRSKSRSKSPAASKSRSRSPRRSASRSRSRSPAAGGGGDDAPADNQVVNGDDA